MSRSFRNKPWKCSCCRDKGPRKDARGPQVEEFEDPNDTWDTICECLLCGTVAPEWQLVRQMCPHGLE